MKHRGQGDNIVEKRAGLRCPVHLFVMGEFRNKPFSSTAQNLSSSGMFFETDRIFAAHDRITCSFVLQHKLTIEGEIVRSSARASDVYDYGVRFLNIDPGTKGEIEALIRSRMKR